MQYAKLSLTLATVALATGAAVAETINVDFGNWDRAQWLPVREERFPRIVPFVQLEGYIENELPVGADEKDIVAAKDGLGVAVMVLREFAALDLAVRCEMAFERKAAPAINFRARRQGEVMGDAYSLVLYEKGLNLWKCVAGKWSKVGAAEFAPAPGEFHEVRLYAEGGSFRVYVDGQARLNCVDSEALGTGEVGIWSGEGPCRFRSFRIRAQRCPIPGD